MIARLSPLRPIGGAEPAGAPVQRTGEGAQSIFGAIFQGAVNNLREANAQTVETEYLLTTGQLDNPAALGIAQTKEAAALDMLIQLRNRALEAYSELSRMNL